MRKNRTSPLPVVHTSASSCFLPSSLLARSSRARVFSAASVAAAACASRATTSASNSGALILYGPVNWARDANPSAYVGVSPWTPFRPSSCLFCPETSLQLHSLINSVHGFLSAIPLNPCPRTATHYIPGILRDELLCALVRLLAEMLIRYAAVCVLFANWNLSPLRAFTSVRG
jgi:hypothetical protein